MRRCCCSLSRSRRLLALSSLSPSRTATMRSHATAQSHPHVAPRVARQAIALSPRSTSSTSAIGIRPRRAISASAFRRNDEDETASRRVGRIEIITGPMFSGKSTELLRRAAEHEAAGRRVALVSSSKDTRYGVSSVVTHDGVARPCISVSRLSDLRAAIERGSSSDSSGERGTAGRDDVVPSSSSSTATTTPTTPLLPSLDSYDVIAIDEAQFFDDLVPFATAMADGETTEGSLLPPSPPPPPSPFTLLVAGLDGDSTRSPFGGLLSLVPHAERVTRLSAECAFCGEDAHFSVRLSSPVGGGAARVPSPTLGREKEERDDQVQVGGAESYAPACRRHYLIHSSREKSRKSSSGVAL